MQNCKRQGKNTANEKHLIDIVAESFVSTAAREVEHTNNIPKIMRLTFVGLITRQSLKHLVKVKKEQKRQLSSHFSNCDIQNREMYFRIWNI